ncbi:DEKNAAC103847 [Brettanomyces naardenensis]|uniref:DEKNAAC103847 n=1 Tax=Brettanomyces naardenensis TaxID=13370 RepID=A0A448YPF3_BRENA|nr:DEKNAAC103847 [Brettanomyces naardenensis]
MGKITTKESRQRSRRTPLYREIAAGNGTFKASTKKNGSGETEADTDEVTLDALSSRKILQLAREQQEEIEQEENHVEASSKPRFQFIEPESDEEEDSEISEGEVEYGAEEEEVEYVNEEDMKVLDTYFNRAGDGGNTSGGANGINLADKIMEKIREKEMEKMQENEVDQSNGDSEEPQNDKVFLPPRVIEAYQKVGESLSAWRHGKLPKLFKVLPTIKNWEDILYVTNPDKWTPNVVFEATKLFVSNLPSNKAQRFVSMVLYPRFRQDIEDSEEHKLNYHIYMSLKKCLYKPAAFFKGFLFPLIEEQCTAREAMIVASVLKKCSIPVQHSSVALSWLLDQEFSPQAMVFIRVLIEKKYALPYQTVDDLVFYFMRFRVVTDEDKNQVMLDEEENYEISEQRKIKEAPPLPLVWHKAFLAFAQRYKNDITDDQRDFLMEVVRQRGHKEVGPEIRRELLAGKERAEKEQKVVEDDDIMSYF